MNEYNMIKVILKEHEGGYADAVGIMRYEESRRLGLASAFANRAGDMSATRGELAFAIGMDLDRQLTLNKFKYPDIEGWQVRSTDYMQGRLIIRVRDSDNEPFALVRGSADTWVIAGWLWGREAKIERFKANPGGTGLCYMVPERYLHHMSDLPIFPN